MNIVQQCDRSDKTQVIFDASTAIWWGENDEIIPLDGLKLPDLLHTHGAVGERLHIDPTLVSAYQRAGMLVIPIHHRDRDAPRRRPFAGWLHLLDLLKHGTLHYADDGTPWLEFPSSIIRYPAKKRCARRGGAR